MSAKLDIQTALVDAMRLLAAGDLPQAKERFLMLTSTNPNLAEAQDGLGVIALRQGNGPEAKARFEQAVHLAPKEPRYTQHLAALYDAAGQPAQAIAVCDQFLSHTLAAPIVVERLKRSLLTGDKNWLESSCPPLLSKLPDLEKPLNEMIIALDNAGRIDAVLKLYELLRDKLPASTQQFMISYAKLISMRGQIKEAIQLLEWALPDAADKAEIHTQLGLKYRQLANFAKAREHLRQASAINPSLSKARFELNVIELLESNLADGLDGYESRFGLDMTQWREPPFPRWQGEALAGKEVLVWTEQGFGDILMFCTFFPYLLKLQPKAITVSVNKVEMLPLLARSFPQIRFVEQQRNPASEIYDRNYDVALPIGDVLRYCLPHYTPSAQGNAPICTPDADKATYWKKWLDTFGPGRKIGFSWFTTNTVNAVVRNIPLPAWLPLFNIAGCHFITLQHSDHDIDLNAFVSQYGLTNLRVPPINVKKDIEDLAAIAACVDEIISVQNANIHLGGVLNTPTTMLLSAASDWRWGLNRADNPWYKSVSIIHQSEPLNWEKPMLEAANRLKKALANG